MKYLLVIVFFSGGVDVGKAVFDNLESCKLLRDQIKQSFDAVPNSSIQILHDCEAVTDNTTEDLNYFRIQ